MMKMRRFLLGFIFVGSLINNLFSQQAKLIDSTNLLKEKLIMSINEALLSPDKAYKLCLGGQELKEVPEDIGKLYNLQEVNMSQNFFKELPDAICNLKNLEEIKLNNNEIKTLPDCLFNLPNLKRLELSNIPGMDWKNILKKIPKLTTLEYIDLSYNDLESLPDDFSGLKNLKEITLSGNKFSEAEKNRIKTLMKNVKIEFN
jgi:Leucine-rich repeat (LRR) protein